MTYNQIVKYFGSVAAAARKLDYTRAGIYHWRDNGIPIRTQQWIETRTRGVMKASGK